jgi:hypothetical protein
MTANDYMHMCRDFQTAFKTCIALSTYIKLLGGEKTKLTSIHPEDLRDSLALGFVSQQSNWMWPELFKK